MTRCGRGIAYVFLIVLLGIPSLAQRQSGAIFGKIVDDTGIPLPGASVTLSGPSMMGTISFTSTDNGDFRFPTVPPGNDYVIAVEMPGFQKTRQEGVIVNVGKTTTLSISLKSQVLDEEITVTAQTPTVDATTTKLSVNLTQDFIENIPIERDHIEVIRAAPGTISGIDTNMTSFVTHGGTERSNQVALDGVNIQDPYTGVTRITIPFDMLEEFEIEFGSHPAEIGTTDGAYVNIVTKSGGNRFSGEAGVYFFNQNLVQSLVPGSEAEAVGLSSPLGYKDWKDFSFSLGGPIFKDKFWFFFNTRYLDWTQNAESIVDGSFEAPGQRFMSFIKLSGQPHPKLKLMGMWTFTNWHQDYFHPTIGFDYYLPAGSMEFVDNSQSHVVTGNLNWVLDKDTFFDGRVNYYRNFDPFLIQPDWDQSKPSTFDNYTKTWTGPARGSEEHTADRIQMSVSGTHFADSILQSNHEFKAGLEVDTGKYSWDVYRQSPYFQFTTYKGLPWGLHNVQPYLGFFQTGRIAKNRNESLTRSAQRRFSAYLQDKMLIKDRLSLNIGLRLDHSSADLIGGLYKPAGAYDPVLRVVAPHIYKETIVPDAKNAITWTILSPRIGMVFDVFGDSKAALKASWSRYNEALRMHHIMPLCPMFRMSYATYWMDLDQDGVVDADDGFTEARSFGDPDEFNIDKVLDKDLASPYVDELFVGIEYELLRDLNVSLAYINKKHNRLVQTIDSNRGYSPDGEWWLPYTTTEPGWDGVFGTADDAQITVYGLKDGAPPYQQYLTNVEEATRHYQALDFMLRKRMSHGWQFLGSITYSKYEGNLNADVYGSWGQNYEFDTPNWLVNRFGRIDFDRPWQIKLQGSVMLPWDLMLSGYYFHMSGAPWARTLKIQLPNDPVYHPSVRGKLIEAYYPIYAESPGTRRYRSRNNLDIRIEKTFYITRNGRLGIFADVLNVFGESYFEVNQDPGGYVYANGTFGQWPWYGQFTSAYGTRTLKLSARFTF